MDSTTLRDGPILRATAALAVACLAALLSAPGAGAEPLMPRSVGAITITLTRHPPVLSSSGQATFDWRTSGIIGETRCKLDSAAFKFCPGIPSRYGGLSEGRHTFTVRVRNGYQVTAKATWTWTIDTTAPTAPTVSGGSASWRNGGSGQITAAGSADSGSGLAGYQWRAETDGGAWSTAAPGPTASVRAQGTSYVQFRSVDKAGNVSAWQPSPNGVANMLRLDRTAPSAPTVTGGSLSWQGVASVTLNGSGSTDALSGVDHYEYRESADGGATWSAPLSGASDTVSAEGQTIVQFRAVDAAGNAGAWAPAAPGAGNTVRIDRSGPSDPVVWGGSASWQSAPSVTVSAAGSVDTGFGVDHYEYRESADGGVTWGAPSIGSSDTVTAEGQMLVQFRSLDTAGNPSGWAPAPGTAAGTVRIDRTPPADPTVSITPAGWQSAAAILVFAGGSTDALAGVDHYQFRSSADGGATWSLPVTGATGMVTAAGTTIVEFRAVDGAGNTSAWAPASSGPWNTVNIDRTPPTPPAVSGGSATWQTAASVAVTATGGNDALSGVDHYQYRTSTDGGTTWSAALTGATVYVTAAGTTLVQFRATDVSGLRSAWGPSPATAGSTVNIDRIAPSAPVVSGGSLAWHNVPSVAISAAGGSDTGGAGLAMPQYRTSTDGGMTWSAPTTAASVQVTAEGETLVQFRNADAAGNTSAWAPAAATAGSTVRLDRTAPSALTVSGGSLICAGTRTISASGAADGNGSGVNHYEYEVSTDGGTTYGAATTGHTVTFTASGSYVVQFRAVDGVGLVSAWTPVSPGAANTACIA